MSNPIRHSPSTQHNWEEANRQQKKSIDRLLAHWTALEDWLGSESLWLSPKVVLDKMKEIRGESGKEGS